jgi:starch phosphorylase
VQVNFGGHTETYTDEDGVERTRWVPGWNVLGVPYNYMVPGYLNGRVNTLRLWSAQATKAFDLQIFNSGDYAQAVRAQTFAENISKVLYPEDSTPQGKELRLQQQYFFVACSLHDFIDNELEEDFDLHKLPERIIFQLNDTHPVIAVPELMRILVDEKGFDWDEAWDDHQQVLRLHLPHAAARGPRGVADRPARPPAAAPPGDHLPINEEFLARSARQFPGDELRPAACRSSPSTRARRPDGLPGHRRGTKVNGVAELHSQLLRDKVLPDFSRDVARQVHQRHQRRHAAPLRQAGQPEAVELITDTIGSAG